MDSIASKFTRHIETEAGGKEINKNKTGFPQIIKDLNSRLIWDGERMALEISLSG